MLLSLLGKLLSLLTFLGCCSQRVSNLMPSHHPDGITLLLAPHAVLLKWPRREPLPMLVTERSAHFGQDFYAPSQRHPRTIVHALITTVTVIPITTADCRLSPWAPFPVDARKALRKGLRVWGRFACGPFPSSSHAQGRSCFLIRQVYPVDGAPRTVGRAPVAACAGAREREDQARGGSQGVGRVKAANVAGRAGAWKVAPVLRKCGSGVTGVTRLCTLEGRVHADVWESISCQTLTHFYAH